MEKLQLEFIFLDAINTLFYLIILNCMHDGNFT